MQVIGPVDTKEARVTANKVNVDGTHHRLLHEVEIHTFAASSWPNNNLKEPFSKTLLHLCRLQRKPVWRGCKHDSKARKVTLSMC